MATQLVRHMTVAANQRTRERSAINERRAREDAERIAQRAQEDVEFDLRWLATICEFIDDLIRNTSGRLKNRGIKRADRAQALYMMTYDDTYRDVHDTKDRDYKNETFFEPLLGLFDGDRAKLIREIVRSLDSYFKIAAGLNKVWRPKFERVPFKPRQKSDKRTTRLTLRFRRGNKKTT